MNILLGLHQFLPEFSTGTELIAYYIAKELQRRGHEVTVLTGFPGNPGNLPNPRVEPYLYDGLNCLRFHHAYEKEEGQTSEFESEYNHRYLYRWLSEYLRDRRPDVAHFLHLSRISASALDACADTGTPTVFTATDFWAICPTVQLRMPDNSLCRGPAADGHNCIRHLMSMRPDPRVTRKLERMPDWLLRLGIHALRRGWFKKRFAGKWYTGHIQAVLNRPANLKGRFATIDRILVPSHLMEEMFVANGFQAEQIKYLPYGIPVEYIERAAEKPAAGPLRLLFVGQIAEHKGCHILLEAMKSVPKELPVQLRIFGNLDQRPEYTEKIRAIAGDDSRIEFAGHLPNKAISAAFRDADVLICPSIWYENTPLVIYEAMAAGVPVVASDLKGMAEAIKPEINGLLFRNGDAADLAKVIRRLAQDRPLAAKMAARTEPPLSVAGHVNHLETCYCDITASRAPASSISRLQSAPLVTS